jgi:hypothetical protein
VAFDSKSATIEQLDFRYLFWSFGVVICYSSCQILSSFDRRPRSAQTTADMGRALKKWMIDCTCWKSSSKRQMPVGVYLHTLHLFSRTAIWKQINVWSSNWKIWKQPDFIFTTPLYDPIHPVDIEPPKNLLTKENVSLIFLAVFRFSCPSFYEIFHENWLFSLRSIRLSIGQCAQNMRLWVERWKSEGVTKRIAIQSQTIAQNSSWNVQSRFIPLKMKNTQRSNHKKTVFSPGNICSMGMHRPFEFEMAQIKWIEIKLLEFPC